MQDKISIPTDNIYKFYALFSLLLLIVTVSAAIYVMNFTNELIIKNLIEIQTIDAEIEPMDAPDPTSPQLTRRAILKWQVESAQSDRITYWLVLGVLLGLSLSGMYYGFSKWHKEVQALNDEVVRVQLEIAKLQLAKLKAEAKSDDG